MAQQATFKWTNAAAAAARTQLLGFAPAHIVILGDSGVVARFEWNDQMAEGSVIVTSQLGAMTKSTADGITYNSSPVGQFGQPLVGAGAAAFTNANPGVITVSDGSVFRAGDVISVSGVANTAVGETLNGQYTIASISGDALTTTTNTTAYGVRVSGGNASLVSRVDAEGNLSPSVVSNSAGFSVLIGTAAVGANDQEMVMTVWGKNNVT